MFFYVLSSVSAYKLWSVVLFTLFVFVYVWWCPTHTVLCFSFDVRRLMYPMLQVTLDCQYLIGTFCIL